MMALLAAMAMQAHGYELVVRFPGNNLGYNHVYRSAAACNRAREVILADYRARVAERKREPDGQYYVPGPPPIAVCVPL